MIIVFWSFEISKSKLCILIIENDKPKYDDHTSIIRNKSTTFLGLPEKNEFFVENANKISYKLICIYSFS